MEAKRKVVVMGAARCGKTSLIRRWSDNEFDGSEASTLGVNVVIRQGSQVWDCSGQDRFHALALTYLSGAHAVVFVYSIASYASFTELKEFWIPTVLGAHFPTLAMYMVGTKLDLEQQDGLREVSVQDAVELAARYDLHYGEASAKDAHGIDHLKLFIEDRSQQPAPGEGGGDPSTTAPLDPDDLGLMVLEPFPKKKWYTLFSGGCCCPWLRARKYSGLDT
jgi:small GTP-binding protein